MIVEKLLEGPQSLGIVGIGSFAGELISSADSTVFLRPQTLTAGQGFNGYWIGLKAITHGSEFPKPSIGSIGWLATLPSSMKSSPKNQQLSCLRCLSNFTEQAVMD